MNNYNTVISFMRHCKDLIRDDVICKYDSCFNAYQKLRPYSTTMAIADKNINAKYEIYESVW